MPPSRPFFDPATGALDTGELLREAVPLGKLVAAVAVAAFVPLLLRFVFVQVPALSSVLGLPFVLASQFVLAVGTGVVLLYVVVRANQLGDEG